MRFDSRSIWLCLFVFLAWRTDAQEAHLPSEYRVKAAFIFNFAKFVEWPPEKFKQSNSPFVIGVLGENPFGVDLENTVHGKEVNGRPFLVEPLTSVLAATNCHILFISSSEKKHLPEIIQELHGASILTVSEMDSFTTDGGMINFLMMENKIRFQINDEAAKMAHLKINSKLLGLAVKSSQ